MADEMEDDDKVRSNEEVVGRVAEDDDDAEEFEDAEDVEQEDADDEEDEGA